MTVGAAIEMWSLTNSSLSSSSGHMRRAEFSKGYSVVTDPTDDADLVYDAPDLPRIGDRWPGTAQIRVKSKDPQRISPIYWVVVVRWEGEFGPGGPSDDPVNSPPLPKWRNVITDEPIDTDRFGKPIVTVNGEPVNGLTEKVVDLAATMERNYAIGAFNASQIIQYMRSVNNDTIVTRIGNFQPGLGRLTKFEPDEEWDTQQGGYFKVQAEVTFRTPYNVTPAKAWAKRWRHEGYMVKVPGRTDPIHALDGNGDKVSKPVLLNSSGEEETDRTKALWSTDAASGLPHETLTPLPYSALGLF